MSDEQTTSDDRISKPPPKGEGEFPRETEHRPIVRDDEKNPVIRKLDLVEYVQPIKDGQRDMRLEGRVGMGILGVLTVVARDPSAALKIVMSSVDNTPLTALIRFLQHL